MRQEASLNAEILEERASAYARTVERMQSALEALAGCDPTATREREDLLALAAERVWYLVVQRDALGFTTHDRTLDAYGVPREVQARIGPRGRGGGHP